MRLLVPALALVAVAAVGAVLWSAPWLVGIGAATTDDLKTVSNRLTAKLPVMIDAETRLESAEAGAGLEQVFRFRLVNKDARELEASGREPVDRDAVVEHPFVLERKHVFGAAQRLQRCHCLLRQ